ncbi:DUF2829 domain-containing protein [Xenorhabdus szentirmaii]|uniref:DUF2829 domain-containing protein n=1 Tax=Xenorhabdus szentirmaii TaxID=290112 RepID=UPI0019BD3E09|nr:MULTISPECIES: DUF2829 domain-containing protein [unclassified Xenorhabdus]MBD2793075.1 DUF2829 domain-containing protein [Xenorhabdus sp. CUL]MBD2824534.1 DUF2829 domain-containing protein [Xenorhabdus sp. 5]
MSEIKNSNLTEKKNKTPEHECQFNLGDFKDEKIIAPVGSFSWALIQLKLGNNISRKSWTKKEHLKFVPRKTNGEDKYDYLSHIDKRNIYGNWGPWQPNQEDLMACDWELFKPKSEDCMMSFELELGTASFNHGHDWGYIDQEGKWLSGSQSTFGTLTPISNKTVIKQVLAFYWSTYDHFYLIVSSDKEDNSKLLELITKNLYITVDDVTYFIGFAPPLDDRNNRYTISYGTNDVRNFGEVLKHTNEKKTFCLNWRNR